MKVLHHKAHGLEWQITLDDWDCAAAEANLCVGSVCAQINTLSYADAVRLHAALIKVSKAYEQAMGDPDAQLDALVQMPEQGLQIEENARRAALHGWAKMPRESHTVVLGAV